MLPIDYETHVFDLVHANKFDEPKWDLKYNYRTEYGLKDMSPSTFFSHSEKILYNETACQQYRNNRYVGGPGIKDPTEPCAFEMRLSFHCQTIAADYDEWQMCRDIDIDQFKNGNEIMSLANTFNNHWYIPKQHAKSTHNTTESVKYAAEKLSQRSSPAHNLFKFFMGNN